MGYVPPEDRSPWTVEDILKPLAQVAEVFPADAKSVKNFADGIGRAEDLQCVLGDGHEPGIYLRWLCLLKLICQRWKDDRADGSVCWCPAQGAVATEPPDMRQLQERLWRAYGQQEPGARGDKWPSEWLRGAFYHSLTANLWPASSYRQPLRYPRSRSLAIALETVWNQIRAVDGLPPLTLDALAAVSVGGKDSGSLGDALERLEWWLVSEGQRSCDHLSRLKADHFVCAPGDARARQLTHVASWLAPSGDSGTPLLNVWSDNNSQGLTAFVTALCCSAKDNTKGLQRQSRPSLIYVPLHEWEVEGKSRRVNQQDVLDFLLQALGIGAASGATAPAGRDEKIEAIQAALARLHVLVIFDGVRISSPPFAAVWNLIRNTEWTALLKTLLQAPDAALRATGGRYRGRILVTSNRALDELAAWMPTAPIELAAVGVEEAARELFDTTIASDLIDALGRRLQQLWPSSWARPQINAVRVCHLYLPTAQSAMDASQMGLRVLHDERDLTLLRCALDIGQVPQDGAVDPGVLRAWLARPERADAALVIQLLAVSVSGLRVDTTYRCLGQLAAKLPAERDRLMAWRERLCEPGFVAAFAARYRFMVELSLDGDLLGISKHQAQFELRGQHGDAQIAPALGKHYLDLRNEGIRERIVGDMLATAAGVQRFCCMNDVLAHEGLAQASALSRRAGPHVHLGHVALRRYVQTLYFALMSLDTAELSGHDLRPEMQPLSLAGGALPTGAYRRYVYLYELLYRKTLEQAPDWMIGRGIGREDLRLPLLAIFVNPGWARRVIALLPQRKPDQRSFQSFGAFTDGATAEFGTPLQPIAPHLRGALGVDLFKALLHACLRGGRERSFAQQADVVAGQIVFFRSGRQQDAHSRQIRRSFAKIAIDALQASNRLDEADPRCQRELAAIHAMLPYGELTTLGRQLRAQGWRKQSLEDKTLAPLVHSLRDLAPQDLEHVSDILFRVGELLASKADWEDNPHDVPASLERYAHAYAVFWLADRSRAHGAGLDDDSVEWPTASAPALRYFIRVSLRLAKLLALLAPSAPPGEQAAWQQQAQAFYSYARGRIDVYARHMVRLPIERVHSLLMLASAARIEAAMTLPQSDRSQHAAQEGLLATSAMYLEEARAHSQALGFNPATHKRFLLERIKTRRKLALASRDPLDEVLANRDLGTLTRLAEGSVYWKRLIGRMRGAAVPEAAR